MIRLNFEGEIHELEPVDKPEDSPKDLGYCPACNRNTPSLPEPVNGTCALCFNHQMKEQP